MTETAGNAGEQPGGDGTTTTPPEFTWHNHVPEDLRGTVSKYKDNAEGVANLAKGYKELSSLFGDKDNLLRLPNDKTSDDDRTAFDTRIKEYLGVPQDVKGYNVQIPEDAASIINTELVDSLKQTALELGIPAKSFEALAGKYIETQVEALKKFEEENPATNFDKEAEDRLRVDWKDDYQKNIDGARAMFEKMFGKEEAAQFDAEIQKNPVYAFSKMFHRINALDNEGRMELGDAGGAERSQLIAVKNKEYLEARDTYMKLDVSHPDRQIAEARMNATLQELNNLRAG